MTGNSAQLMLIRLPLLALLGPLLLSACNETTAATIRQGTDDQANPQLQLLGRVNSLESEVAALRNTVDVQEVELNRLRERLSGIYDDLDRRLRAVGANTPAAALSMTPLPAMADNEIPSVPQQADNSNSTVAPAEAVKEEIVLNVAPVPPVAAVIADEKMAQESAGDVSPQEQASYDRAFELLKQSRYEEAIAAFKEFQTRYPRSSLADSAQYWIAEARYVDRAYDAALHEYNTLIQRYPDSKRLPDAMLKVGYIHFDNEQWEQARRALNTVVIRYPGSRVAVSAKMRLDQMSKTGH
ncbi:tol-pal system protein YbgF [Pseudomonadota bacterium]|jgi:tol-pal system protein YbgF